MWCTTGKNFSTFQSGLLTLDGSLLFPICKFSLCCVEKFCCVLPVVGTGGPHQTFHYQTMSILQS